LIRDILQKLVENSRWPFLKRLGSFIFQTAACLPDFSKMPAASPVSLSVRPQPQAYLPAVAMPIVLPDQAAFGDDLPPIVRPLGYRSPPNAPRRNRAAAYLSPVNRRGEPQVPGVIRRIAIPVNVNINDVELALDDDDEEEAKVV
jgi:hypothetical protein